MLDQLTKLVAEIESEKNIYFFFKPEILDFTDKEIVPELYFSTSSKDFNFQLTDENIYKILPLLKFIFKKDKKIITWNWKNFATYILGKTKKSYFIDSAIIDLKIIESYSGKKNKPPKNLTEALNRLKDLITSGIWKEIEPIYKKLHLPLITTVIPHIETTALIDPLTGGNVYGYYDIDGQENGRLRCFQAFKQGFVPHTMTPDIKDRIKPQENKFFMNFDFKGMEVYTLAWLTKDPLLIECCRQEQEDVYLAIWEKITGKFEKNNRDLVKKIFLPTIYGQSARSLSEHCKIELHLAETIKKQIDTLFPTVLTFFESSLKQLQDLGYAKDCFGKRRQIEVHKDYLVRNFSVQSPAAVVCLEKLINLYFALKDKTDIAYSIHDGYVVYATRENWKTIYKIGRDILTSESEFCPGLKLKVAVKAGVKLNDMKPLEKKK